MPAPGTPKRMITRTHHSECLKSSSPRTPIPAKAARPPKAPKPKLTPVRKPGTAPFEVRTMVQKFDKKDSINNIEQKSTTKGDEPESTDILVCDEMKHLVQKPMDTDDESTLSEITSGSPTKPKQNPKPTLQQLEIPNSIRNSVGPNWRMKEGLLNSYHFGAPSVRPTDFARSKLDVSTAEILANPNFSLEAKKHSVKLFLGKKVFHRFFIDVSYLFHIRFSQL